MKRLLLAVALVSALATAAQATQGRVAIVYPSNLTNDAASSAGNVNIQLQRNLKMLTDVLDAGGVDYFVMPGRQAKIEQLRRGVIARGSQVDTVVGVIHASFFGYVSSNAQVQYRGDSLMRIETNSTVSGVDVPHLFLADNVQPLSNVGNARYLADDGGPAAARCTTGVVGDKTAPAQGQGLFWYGDKTRRFLNTPYTSGWVMNATAPAGGIRPILGMSASGRSIAWFDAAAENRNATWPDSMPFVEASDTLSVWERLWNVATIPTAKPMVFCDWAGAGASSDSTGGGLELPSCEGNLQVLLVGLARFDSLCGGIFKRPVDGAIVVKSALSRGLRRWNRGIAPSDTAVFYGSLDSLKAWGVPVTFYANTDSASTYARDVIKLKEVGRARFSPQVWDGVADTTKGQTWVARSSTNLGLPRDIFGVNTNRAAYGDGSGVGADSSVWAQLVSAKAKCDSVFGVGRGSNSLWPPLDDWTPKLVTYTKGVQKLDSVLWAMARAGFHALIVNGRKPDRVAGGFTRQRTYKTALDRESEVRILAHNGGMLCGGQYQQMAFDDSATVPARVGNLEREVARAMAGIFLTSYTDYDIFQYDDAGSSGFRNWSGIRFEPEDMFQATFPKHGSVVHLSCADLSGAASGPARSGLWVIKSLWQTSEITRLMAKGGRPLLRLTYPEDVEL